MKTIKLILIAATLISASVVSTMSAQQDAQSAAAKTYAVGDSIMIKPECTQYLTGETPSKWVYKVPHVVKQVGTKRFPDGILLSPINSWVRIEGIKHTDPKKAAAEAVAPAEQPVQPAEQPVQGGDQSAQEGGQQPAQGGEQSAQPEEQGGQQTVQPTDSIAPADNEPAAGGEESVIAAQTAKGDTLATKIKKAGYDRFTIGLRGGAAALLQKSANGKWGIGGDALLDLQYAHYWTKEGRPVELGLLVGLSAGYAQGGFKTAVNDSFTATTSDGTINYTVTADEVKETDRQIQLEVPIMFSLIHKSGLFFNVGPRLMIPVYTPFSQKMSNPQIEALFVEEGVKVVNQAITGVVSPAQQSFSGKDNGNQFKINVMLGAEIGYEWTLSNGHSLGLGAYADYSVFNTFKNAGAASVIDITAPSSTAIAVVNVLPATHACATSVGFFDAGVKVAYHFNFPRKQALKFKESKLF